MELKVLIDKNESILLKPNLLKKAEVDKAVITHPTVVGMFARLMRKRDIRISYWQIPAETERPVR